MEDNQGDIGLVWSGFGEDGLGGFQVVASVSPDQKNHALRWRLEIKNPSTDWTLMSVVFPQLSVAELGEALKCGTNCGSCKPALSQLIDKHLVIEIQSV